VQRDHPAPVPIAAPADQPPAALTPWELAEAEAEADVIDAEVLRPGEAMRVLTPAGFSEGVYDGASVGGIRVRAGARVHEIAFDHVEAVWRLQ